MSVFLDAHEISNVTTSLHTFHDIIRSEYIMDAQTFDRDALDISGAASTGTATANNLKDKASHVLDDAAGQLERAGHSVSDRVATYADKAAGALGSTAEYVRGIESRDVMEDITSMAKRHPGVTLAAAAVVGFLAGRAATRS